MWPGAANLSVNSDDASSEDYAVLDTLESFRGADCKLTLRLRWPTWAYGEEPGALASDLSWKQSSNPVLQAACDAVEGYEELPPAPPVQT